MKTPTIIKHWFSDAMHFTLIIFVASIAALGCFSGCFAEKRNYNVFVSERGTILRELTMTDVEQNTVRFIMPAHFDLDAVDMLMDFNRNFSIKYFPDKHACLVSKLDTESLLSPSSLQTALEKDKGLLWENAPFVNQTYVIAGVFYDGLVTDSIRSHCKGASIKWVKKSTHKGEANVTNETGVSLHLSTNEGKQVRTKRQFPNNCPAADKRDACIVMERHCYYVITCTPENPDGGTNTDTACREHRFGVVTCCTPCCINPSGASDFRPDCAVLRTPEDVRQRARCA